MPFHNLRLAYFTGDKFVPDPGSFGDDDPFDYQSIIDQIARDQAEKSPEEQFATAEGNVTFEELIDQFETERGQETTAPQPVPLPSALDGNAPSTEQPFGGIDMEPLSRLTEDTEELGPMEPVPGMEPGTDEGAPGEPSSFDTMPEDGEIGDDKDDYEGAFDDAQDILGPEKGDIDLGVPVTEDEDDDFGALPSPSDLIPEEGLDSETEDALEGGEMEEIFPDIDEDIDKGEEIFPDIDEGQAEGEKNYGLAKAILSGKERQKVAAAIARKVVADTINIDFTFNDEGRPEVDIDEDLGSGKDDLPGDDLLEGEGEDLFGEEGEDDLFGEEIGTKSKGGDDLFDELGEGGESDLLGEEPGGGVEPGGGEDFLGI